MRRSSIRPRNGRHVLPPGPDGRRASRYADVPWRERPRKPLNPWWDGWDSFVVLIVVCLTFGLSVGGFRGLVDGRSVLASIAMLLAGLAVGIVASLYMMRLVRRP
jgi:hypothetical protein